MDYLHWIGNQFYTMESFIDEAEKHGVSRRIQLKVLQGMGWNDRIFVGMHKVKTIKVTGKRGKPIDKVIKTPIIFGYFKIEKLHGINLQTMPEELQPKFKKERYTGNPPSKIKRGCGTQKNSGFYIETGVTLKQIADNTRIDEDMDIEGGLRVIRPVVMQNLLSFRGFRKFDGQGFMKDMVAQITSLYNKDCSLFLDKNYYVD